ncbi:transposase [Nitrobacter sp. TKz-YC01]|uniref:transposase n=1 Tax=Nitrobacter sp. TKz-YC01 TaxID=3398703 RepID=UPI003A0FBBAB
MLADALGRPLRFIVTAGQVGDITQAPALLEAQAGDAVLADKAYDSNALRALIAGMGAEAVIPSNRTRKIIIPHDAGLYKHRNRMTPVSTNTATGSSAASTVSNTSAVSPPATTGAPFTSRASFTWPQP